MTGFADAEVRRTVWISFSELYLDTDPAPGFDPIARTLAESPYSIGELRRILFEEVHPAVRSNLLTSVGVWDGFDADGLCARIAGRQRRPRWLRLPAGMFSVCARESWAELEPRVARLRGSFGEVPGHGKPSAP